MEESTEHVGGPWLEPAAGRLLIASPILVDPNFARSLVLLLDVGEDGALGVVLNRPSDVPVGGVLEEWASAVGLPDVLFSGGPVEPQAALAVGTLVDPASPPAGWRPLFGASGLVDLDAEAGVVRAELSGLRIYAGYAGWGLGQLEAEIEEGSWYVVPADASDLHCTEPDQLWARVLRRQPGRLALLTTLPADPELN